MYKLSCAFIAASEIMLSGVLDKLADDPQDFDLFSGSFIILLFEYMLCC